MGTNYYATTESEGYKIHIGKNSSGWKFAINENRKYWRTPLDLFEFLLRSDVTITDEYGKEYPGEKMVKIIINNSVGENKKVSTHDHNYTIDGYRFHIGEFC